MPQIGYDSFVKGLSNKQVDDIKRTGVVVVKGGVPGEEALGWKQSILEYAGLNRDKLKGMHTHIATVQFTLNNSTIRRLPRRQHSLLRIVQLPRPNRRPLTSLPRKYPAYPSLSLAYPFLYHNRPRSSLTHYSPIVFRPPANSSPGSISFCAGVPS